MAGGAEVAHFGGLVELGAHAVAHKVPDYREAVGLHIDLDRVADVAHPAARSGIRNALPEAALGDLDQPLRLRQGQGRLDGVVEQVPQDDA